MGRFFASLVVGLLIFGAIAWHLDLIQFNEPSSVDPKQATNTGTDVQPSRQLDLGGNLYMPAKLELDETGPIPLGKVEDPIVIQGELRTIDKLEVSSAIDGVMLFVGEELPIGVAQAAGVAPFLTDPFNYARIKNIEAELVKQPDQSTRVEFVERWTTKLYCRLYKSETVGQDQVVCFLDPARAMTEKRAKRTKLETAEAESRAAHATARESKANFERARELLRQKAIAEYEYSVALLTYVRAQEEAVAKEQAVKASQIELEQVQFFLDQHAIRNRLPVERAMIKDIFAGRGGAVKAQDKLMELHSLDRLMADGLVEVPDWNRIHVGMPVTIEPQEEESPIRVFRAHRGEITNVAFTQDRLIVSAGDDKRVLVWDPALTIPKHEFKQLPEAINALACSPVGAGKNWVAVGCADGAIFLWDLTDPKTPARRIPEADRAHRDAVTALAISPDGNYLASGSTDGSLKMWDLNTGVIAYAFDREHGVLDPHQGTISSIHFTPQGRLVTASRDNTLRVWTLFYKGALPTIDPVPGRHGSISQLGVSDDGRWMIFDQAKTLQILSVADGRTLTTLQNPRGSNPFDTLALFSPDGKLMLTGGAPEGRLQLWSTPTPSSRAFEVRQFVTQERSPVTCAAFSPPGPDGKVFVVTGTKDNLVYLWTVPTPEQIANHRITGLTLTSVNYAFDATNRHRPIAVEIQNNVSTRYPHGRLSPGRPVNIVLEP